LYVLLYTRNVLNLTSLPAAHTLRNLVSGADATLQTFQDKFKDMKGKLLDQINAYTAVWVREGRAIGGQQRESK
jgi:hypothetical protein